MTDAVPSDTDNADPAPVDADNTEAKADAATETLVKVDEKAPVTTPKDWRSDFEDESLRDNPSISKFSSGETLAKSYINLEKMLGGDKIALPKTEEDTEGWDKVFNALGRPEDAKGYEFAEPADLPEGFEYDSAAEESFREIAHAARLTKTQATALRDWFVNVKAAEHAAGEESVAAKMAESIGELTNEWGRATPQKIEAAHAAVKKLAGDDFAAMLDETGLGNDPRLVRGFAKIAEAVAGDKNLIGDALTESTPAQLTAQIAEFETTHRAALLDKFHPEHDSRVKQRSALYEKKFPNEAA